MPEFFLGEDLASSWSRGGGGVSRTFPVPQKTSNMTFGPGADTARPLPVDFELPDGQLLLLGPERFQCAHRTLNPEPLAFFEPSMCFFCRSNVGGGEV